MFVRVQTSSKVGKAILLYMQLYRILPGGPRGFLAVSGCFRRVSEGIRGVSRDLREVLGLREFQQVPGGDLKAFKGFQGVPRGHSAFWGMGLFKRGSQGCSRRPQGLGC